MYSSITLASIVAAALDVKIGDLLD